jgi:hypothetical protein
MNEQQEQQLQFDIVPTHLAVQAMRDNGYKNAAHAIAELMDNAIQANAKLVELLVGEKVTMVEQRQRSRVDQLAVLDNGSGMTPEVLRMALQFGNGTRLDATQQTGIGRFGMGLPASSISQCTRVDVWTWQNGPDSAVHSYLDLDRIRHQGQTTVPQPEPRAIPSMWRNVGQEFGKSGTLVVWSNLDRLIWRTASAIIDNSEFIIGRMYRKFLCDGGVKIRLVAFDVDKAQEPTLTPGQVAGMKEKWAQPNDPGYLMADTSCPPPFDKEPMFKPLGEEYERIFVINFRGQDHEVKVRFSYAKEEARPNDQAGNTNHGRHAGRNVGVSIVRAGRELELDQGLVIQYDPRERWWGVELDFPPALDDLFGVSNNKQSARNFADMAKFEFESLLKGGTTPNEVMAIMKQEGDPKAALFEIVHCIDTQIGMLREHIKAQTKGSRSAQRHGTGSSKAEETATIKTKERQEQGYEGRSDKDESLPDEQKQEIIQQTLEDEGLPAKAAEELAATTVSHGYKYVFADAELETAAFFSVKPKAGVLIVTLNTAHPAYDKLVDILEEDVEGVDAASLRERLTNALDGLKVLLTAWARYEDELEGVRRQNAQDARNDWGRIARGFLASEE